ncbi:unnamed protein product, partial [Dicrocoelium dendriticum]
MNEISPGLWIGSYPFKEDISKLTRSGIKSVLTLDITPLPESIFGCFSLKFIFLRDEPGQDLLFVLEDALSFIESSLKAGGILVHWYNVSSYRRIFSRVGVSRSAAIVIAFLMRKNQLSYDSALERVVQKRYVCPNIGFVNQLKLFEVMNYTVDTNSPVYLQYAASRKFRGHLAAHDNGIASEIQHQSLSENIAAYRCKKCRRGLFSSSDLVNHCIPERITPAKAAQSQPAVRDGDVSTVLIKGITLNEPRIPCDRKELFTGLLEWATPSTHEVEGK